MWYRIEERTVKINNKLHAPVACAWRASNQRVFASKIMAYQALCSVVGCIPTQLVDGYGVYYKSCNTDSLHWRIVAVPADETADQLDRQITL